MYYVRFQLSLRQVQDIIHEWGSDICHETVRFWWNSYRNPHVIVTDKLGSNRAALRGIGYSGNHQICRYQNNNNENLNLHFRLGERAMNSFRSMGSLQKFMFIQS